MTTFQWKADGDSWVLLCERRKFGRVVPDKVHPGMWRSTMRDGGLSDFANLTRARHALIESARREIAYEQKLATRDPLNCSESGAVFERHSPSSDLKDESAVGVADAA